MAKAKRRSFNRASDWMMPDNKTISHMTLFSENLQAANSFDVTVTLVDDSSFVASFEDTRIVKRSGTNGSTKAQPSETLVVPDMTLSPLPILALAKKIISVIIMPRKDFVANVGDSFSVLGTTVQADEVLY